MVGCSHSEVNTDETKAIEAAKHCASTTALFISTASSAEDDDDDIVVVQFGSRRRASTTADQFTKSKRQTEDLLSKATFTSHQSTTCRNGQKALHQLPRNAPGTHHRRQIHLSNTSVVQQCDVSTHCVPRRFVGMESPHELGGRHWMPLPNRKQVTIHSQ